MPLISDTLRSLSSALIAAALIIAALVLGKEILVPLALAGVLCFILAPMINKLVTWRVPRGAAIALVVALVTGLGAIASVSLTNQLLSLAGSLSDYKANVAVKIRDVASGARAEGALTRAMDAVASYRKLFDQEVNKSGAAASEGASSAQPPVTRVVIQEPKSGFGGLAALELLASPLAQAALTILFTIFLLGQYRDLRDRVVRVIGTDNMSESTAAMSDAGDKLSNLFVMQATLNAAFGTFVGIALWLIGVPNPVLWGVLTFVMRFVPYIGSFLGAIPPIFLALAIDPGWTTGLVTLAVFLIGEPLMGHVVEPLVLGKRIGVSPFAMIVAAAFWTMIWGPVGLILAAPLTMMAVVLGRYIPSLEFMSVLLGDEDALSPPQVFYQRLLSGDVYGAYDQIEAARKDSSNNAIGDDIVIPALRLAATDARRAKLDTEQIRDLENAIEEVMDIAWPEAPSAASDNEPDIFIVPARGAIDTLAARSIVSVLSHSVSVNPYAPSQSTGLMAISEFKSDQRNVEPELVAIVTAGTTETKYLAHIAKRAQLSFPKAKVVILDNARQFEGSDAMADVARVRTLCELLQFVTLPAADSETSGVKCRPAADEPTKAATGFAAVAAPA